VALATAAPAAAAPAPAVAAPAAAAPAAAAPAAAPSGQLSYSPHGSIDYIWTGVPSRGCAQAGLCGVTGSLQVISGPESTSGSPSIEVIDDSSVVRVEYPGSPARICVDPMAYDVNFRLAGRQAGASQPYADVSAGQCAGPVAGDLAAVRLPVRREANGDYDLTGSQSFGAGPFEVRVLSKLHALVSRGGIGSGGSYSSSGPPPGKYPKPHRVLVEHAQVYYRVANVTGALIDAFAGSPDPLCEPLAACGTTGSVRLAITRIPQELEFSGARIVKRRASRSRALADFRAGRLGFYNNANALDPTVMLAGSLAGPGPHDCTSTILSRFLASMASRPTHTADELYLGAGGVDDVSSNQDPLRTRCPGPGADTIIGEGALASGSVPISAFGAPRIELVFRNSGRFAGLGYAGTRGGSIAITLMRTKVTGGTVRARATDGEVLP
jgi:hypothetical protein